MYVADIPLGHRKNQPLIYFISDGVGHTKIGYTNDISRRMRDLQTGNAEKLFLLLTIDCLSSAEGRFIETVFHEEFSQFHYFAEWFSEKWSENELMELIEKTWDKAMSALPKRLKKERGI